MILLLLTNQFYNYSLKNYGNNYVTIFIPSSNIKNKYAILFFKC
jgi:hypothetical protein